MVDISGSYGKLRKWVTRQLDAIRLEDLADVDKSAQGNNKVLVYKTASAKHEYCAQTGGGAGTGFRAWRNTTQSIPDSLATVLIFNYEFFDIDGCYDVSNGKFAPTTAGYYSVHANIVIGRIADGKKFVVGIKKNGVYQSLDRGVIGGEDYCGACVSCIVYMNGITDYLHATVYHNHGSARNSIGNPGYCTFSSWLLTAPP